MVGSAVEKERVVNLDHVVPWPADLAHAYRVAGCWGGRSLGSWLWSWADERSERVALVDGTHRLTYHDLATMADRLAMRLAALGFERGDSLLLQLPNCWEFVVATFACFRLGVAPVMMLPPHREYELAAVGARVAAKALLVPDVWQGGDHQELAHRVVALLRRPAHVLVVGDEVRSESIDLRGLLEPDGDGGASRQWLDARTPAPGDVALFQLSG